MSFNISLTFNATIFTPFNHKFEKHVMCVRFIYLLLLIVVVVICIFVCDSFISCNLSTEFIPVNWASNVLKSIEPSHKTPYQHNTSIILFIEIVLRMFSVEKCVCVLIKLRKPVREWNKSSRLYLNISMLNVDFQPKIKLRERLFY